MAQIRDLTATRFTNSGFTTTLLDERVLICKNEDRYIAKREGEPALYEVAAPAVSELQKSAADLKPATPAKK